MDEVIWVAFAVLVCSIWMLGHDLPMTGRIWFHLAATMFALGAENTFVGICAVITNMCSIVLWGSWVQQERGKS